jgi:hypothetical protein
LSIFRFSGVKFAEQIDMIAGIAACEEILDRKEDRKVKELKQTNKDQDKLHDCA